MRERMQKTLKKRVVELKAAEKEKETEMVSNLAPDSFEIAVPQMREKVELCRPFFVFLWYQKI